VVLAEVAGVGIFFRLPPFLSHGLLAPMLLGVLLSGAEGEWRILYGHTSATPVGDGPEGG